MYREATANDLPTICVLGQALAQLHYDVWPQIFAPASNPRRDETYWRQCVSTYGATTFIADDSGDVIGFITVHIVDEHLTLLRPIRYGVVGSVFVVEARRHQGIGLELMARAERWAEKHGAVDLRLNVWAFNQSALQMYEELGYEVRSMFLGKPLAHSSRASPSKAPQATIASTQS